MKIDLTGYPKPIRPRRSSMFSKIVAIADGYDAATSRRVVSDRAVSRPQAVLEEMRDNPRRGLDQVLVKAFINLSGIYPVGTLVVLDTFELGIVSRQIPTRKRCRADRARSSATPGQHDQSAAHSGSRGSGGRRPISRARSSRQRTPIDMASPSATTSSNAIARRFAALREESRRALVCYVTAGHPDVERIARTSFKALEEGGRGHHRARRSVLRSDRGRPDHPGELAAGTRKGNDLRRRARPRSSVQGSACRSCCSAT